MNTLFFTWYFLSHWTWDIIDLDEHAFLYVALFISLNMRHYWLGWTRFSLRGTFYLTEHETLLTWMNTLFFTWYFLTHWTWDIIDLDEHAFLYVVLFISLNMRHYWLGWTRFSLRGTFYLTEHETLLTWMNTLFFTWHFLSHWTWDIIDLDEHAFLYVVLFNSLNMRHYWLGWTRFSLRGTFYLTEHETLLTWMNTLFFTWYFLSHWTWDIIDLDEHAFLYVVLLKVWSFFLHCFCSSLNQFYPLSSWCMLEGENITVTIHVYHFWNESGTCVCFHAECMECDDVWIYIQIEYTRSLVACLGGARWHLFQLHNHIIWEW